MHNSDFASVTRVGNADTATNNDRNNNDLSGRCLWTAVPLIDTQVLKFLHENRREGCTTDAVDNAASGAHLDILKFLTSNRAEGGTVYAMTLAAWHGHLDVVKWLHDNRDEVRFTCSHV